MPSMVARRLRSGSIMTMTLKFSNPISIWPRLTTLFAIFPLTLFLMAIGPANAQSDASKQTSPTRTGSAPAAVPAPVPTTTVPPIATVPTGATSGPDVAFGPCPTFPLTPPLGPPRGFQAADAFHATGMSMHAKAAAERVTGDFTAAAVDEAQAQVSFRSELNAVTTSLGTATYKSTPYAAVLMYRIAHIDADLLRPHDYNGAMAQYKTLLSTVSEWYLSRSRCSRSRT